LKALDHEGINLALLSIPLWEVTKDGKSVKRSYDFADFNSAFGFMVRSALKAEEIDHHPDWRNIFNVVDVVLTTHDVKGITEKDIQLARFMDLVYN
tara:strand:+ start:248 stop:535 length:288 start_codon:yes stop_codon:yes gene_type:complete